MFADYSLCVQDGDASGVKAQTFKFKDVEKAMDTAQGTKWGAQVVLEP